MLNQMNHQRLSTWQSLFIVVVFKSFLSSKPTDSICAPMSCGQGPNISYPFYIVGTGFENCGYPGFGINCEEHFPVYATSSNHYVIKNISYEDYTFRLSNIELINNKTSCFSPRNNFSFDRSSLVYTPYHADLVYFYNCTESFHVNYTKSLVGCASSDSLKTYVALVHSDEGLNWTVKECQSSVVAPVQLEQGEVNQTINMVDYGKLLQDGFTLKWSNLIGVHCEVCRKSGGQCGFEEHRSVCYCSDGTHGRHCNGGHSKSLVRKVSIASSAAAIGILVLLVLCFLGKLSVFCTPKTEDNKNVEELLQNFGIFPERYSYSDVKTSTNNFKYKLGEGGYGCVYKGKLHDGRVVAVKLLSKMKGNGEDFINEIASISRTSHVNIVSLVGFCCEKTKRALLYEYMPNGSLEKFIYKEKPDEANPHKLGWTMLYEISIGIARGLEYLHRGCTTRILHFDIKPHNILLDQDFCPKISDFGLAKICPQEQSTISMLGPRGTAGYIAPEVFCRNFGSVSYKSDVYSYGMMVLEMVGGRKNIDVKVDHSSAIYFPHWIYKKVEVEEDLGLEGISNQQDEDTIRKMIIVSLWCIQSDPSVRPTMSKVVEMLEGSLALLQIPPKPYLSSPPRIPADSSTTTWVS